MDFSRIGPAAGCLSSIAFTVCWIISALLWDEWTLGEYSLSSLGACGVDSAEMFFNFGCLITGFLVIFPGLYLIEEKNVYFRISGYAALICSLACAAIGVITENYGAMHNLTASIYAVFAATFIASSAAGDYLEGKKALTAVAAILLAVSGILSLTTSFEVFEPVAVSCILLWTFIQSAVLLIRNTKEGVSGTDH